MNMPSTSKSTRSTMSISSSNYTTPIKPSSSSVASSGSSRRRHPTSSYASGKSKSRQRRQPLNVSVDVTPQSQRRQRQGLHSPLSRMKNQARVVRRVEASDSTKKHHGTAKPHSHSGHKSRPNAQHRPQDRVDGNVRARSAVPQYVIPPVKHRRDSGKDALKYASVKRAIEELNRAIGHDKRIAAITNACVEFDHRDETKHNYELNMGAANVLSLVLSMTDDDDEIRMICAALEMVYRARSDAVKNSFQEVGAAVVPLMLRLLERCEHGSMKHADVSILNITKVLLYFSRIQDLRVPLARHQGLLSALTRVSTSILIPDCRVIRMRVMANLANAENNKMMMFEHTGLLESILKVATLDTSENAREYASATLMDLASNPVNQVPMARHDKVLGALVKLSVMEDHAETREFAITGLQNLAFAKENRTRLATFGSGVVLEALKKTVGSDPNDKARRRAAGALTNLACEDTADRLGCHKGLLETLSSVATTDSNEDVRKRAVLALTKVATSITRDMPCHDALLDALAVASYSPNASGLSAVLRVKARIVENRECMANHPGILDSLSEICLKDENHVHSKERDNAIRAIMHLTNESGNRKVMCNKMVLTSLIKGASLTGSENEETRDSAILALERLGTEHSNRQEMARKAGMIVSIAQAAEREMNDELAGKEAPAGTERLAKQLLMSLLLAI